MPFVSEQVRCLLFGCRSCEGEWNLAATGRVQSITVIPIGSPCCNRRPGNNRCAPRYGHRGCLSVGKDRGMCSSFQCSNIHQYPSFFAPSIERVIGRTGIKVLSKLTGLILSALAAQIVFTGIKHFSSPDIFKKGAGSIPISEPISSVENIEMG